MLGKKKKPPTSTVASDSNANSDVGGLGAALEGTHTLIAHNTRVKGDLFFADQLYVNGEIHGNVSALDASDTVPEAAQVVVCAGGRVVGDIRAPNVVIDGTVEGDVYASGKLELAQKAKVLGNVHYNLVEMQLGSIVNGQMISLSDQTLASSEEASGSEATISQDADEELSEEELAEKKMREAAGDVVTGIR